MTLIQILIAVAFACWNFLLFLSLKTKNNCGQKRQLYPYVANESTHNTPYSKMPTILLFFYSYVNWPSMPRSHLGNSKEFLAGIEALWAN